MFTIKTYTTNVYDFQDCFSNVGELLGTLATEGSLIYYGNVNSRNFDGVFEHVHNVPTIADDNGDEKSFNLEIEDKDFTLELADYDFEGDVEKAIEQAKEKMFHYYAIARGYSQGDYDEYHIVSSRELTDEEKKIFDDMKNTFTVVELRVELRETKHCECCDKTSEEFIDGISSIELDGGNGDEGYLKQLATDNFGEYEIDWENSELSYEYKE